MSTLDALLEVTYTAAYATALFGSMVASTAWKWATDGSQ